MNKGTARHKFNSINSYPVMVKYEIKTAIESIGYGDIKEALKHLNRVPLLAESYEERCKQLFERIYKSLPDGEMVLDEH